MGIISVNLVGFSELNTTAVKDGAAGIFTLKIIAPRNI